MLSDSVRRRCLGNKVKTQPRCLSFERLELPLFVWLEGGPFSSLPVGFAALHHVGVDDRSRSSGCCERVRGAHSGAQTTRTGADVGCAIARGHRGSSKRECCPPVHLPRAGCSCFASTDFFIGGIPEPRGEMRVGRPRGHILTRFGDERQHCGRLKAWNLCDIDSQDLIQRGAGIVGGVVALGFLMAACGRRQRCRGGLPARAHLREQAFDVPISVLNLLLGAWVGVKRLSQHEQMFGAMLPLQGVGNVLC